MKNLVENLFSIVIKGVSIKCKLCLNSLHPCLSRTGALCGPQQLLQSFVCRSLILHTHSRVTHVHQATA